MVIVSGELLRLFFGYMNRFRTDLVSFKMENKILSILLFNKERTILMSLSQKIDEDKKMEITIETKDIVELDSFYPEDSYEIEFDNASISFFIKNIQMDIRGSKKSIYTDHLKRFSEEKVFIKPKEDFYDFVKGAFSLNWKIIFMKEKNELVAVSERDRTKMTYSFGEISDDIFIKVNPEYILDVLQLLEHKDIEFGFKNDEFPMSIIAKSGNVEVKAIVAPIVESLLR